MHPFQCRLGFGRRINDTFCLAPPHRLCTRRAGYRHQGRGLGAHASVFAKPTDLLVGATYIRLVESHLFGYLFRIETVLSKCNEWAA